VRLGSRGESAVADLIRILHRPDVDSWQYDRVADALAGIGPKAQAALPVLRSELKGRPLREQTYLAGKMWIMGEDAGFVCGICSNALTQDLDDNAAMNATGLAASMGLEAQPLTLVLTRSATNAAFSWTTRGWALEAIGRLGLTNETVIQALLAGTLHPYAFIRARCAADLWGIDPQYAALAVRVLVNSITDKQTVTPVTAEPQEVLDSCLRKLDVTMALPALAEISMNGTPEARQIATKALRELEARAEREAAKP
jgi:HEAT repeat protein